MPDSIKMTLLQNAVKDILQLSIVETLDEYTSPTSEDGSFTHLNYSSYYNLLINACMMPPTHQPLPREEMYMLLLVPRISIDEPDKTQFSQDIDTPSDDFYQVHQTKHNKKPSKPLSGFPRDHAKKTTPSALKKPFKKYDGPVYVPAEVYKLLSLEAVVVLKIRNTILRPSTNLPRKEVYMSLTLLTMNYTHLRIPLLRTNMTLINLMMPLTVRVTQFWITSTANTTKRKT